jgi:hypothetical protein
VTGADVVPDGAGAFVGAVGVGVTVAALPTGAGTVAGAALPAAEPVSTGGRPDPVSSGGGSESVGTALPAADPAEPEPIISSRSAFSLASSFSAARLASSEPNFSSASLESLDEMNARTIEVAMKITAALAVSFLRNDDAPEPPNTVAALPPPNAAPMLPPLPDCKSTVSIKKSDTMTCRIVIRVDIRKLSL